MSIKEIIESHGNDWLITKIKQGNSGQIRIDAKTRFHNSDGNNHFSKWCSKKYADRLFIETFGKRSDQMNSWYY